MTYRRTPLVLAWAAVVMGLLVIVVGWALDVEAMRSIVPGTVGMKASTAAMFVLSGIALILKATRRGPTARRVATGCALAVIAYAAAYLAEYAFAVDLGIDELPFRDEAGRQQGIAFPGRLAPLTAVSFVLVGAALLAIDLRLRLVEPLLVPVAAIGTTCLIGYLYSIPAFYGPASAAKMAINTALLFLALAIGIVLARPRGRLWALLTTESPGGIMARRLLPLAVVLPLLLGWLHLEAENAGWLGSRAAAWWLTATTIGCLALVIAHSARTLNRGVIAAQRRFETAFHHAPIGIALVSLDGRVMKPNRALLEIAGYAERDLTGAHMREFVHPDDLDAMLRGHQALLAGDSFEDTVERRYLRRNGGELWVRQSTALVRDDEDAPLHFVAQVEDITQQREDARLKEEFVSVVTHELRTPLTSVAGYLDIVLEDEEDEPLDPHVAHCVRVARRNSQRLIDLVEDLLLVRRLEAGREELVPGPLDLSALVADRLESIVPTAVAKHVTVLGEVEPGVRVEGDARRLAQVVDNLLSNAIKYTPEDGRVWVDLGASGRDAVLTVRDTGIGIPTADQEALFDPFFRASNVARGEVAGTGLGLVVTSRLVEAHGGTIGFESAEGEGSCFSVRLPLGAHQPAVRAATVDLPAAASPALSARG